MMIHYDREKPMGGGHSQNPRLDSAIAFVLGLLFGLYPTSNFVTETAESLNANWGHTSSALCICNCREREREIALSLSLSLSLFILIFTLNLPISSPHFSASNLHVSIMEAINTRAYFSESLSVEKIWRKKGAWQQNGLMESCVGAA